MHADELRAAVRGLMPRAKTAAAVAPAIAIVIGAELMDNPHAGPVSCSSPLARGRRATS